ncbi:MAG: sensor histidine kinase [Haloarculaceae archaeon]
MIERRTDPVALEPRRIVGSALVGATGLLVAALDVAGLATETDLAGLLLGVLGLAIGLGLGAAGLLLYVSDVESDHLLRVAGWNALGVVVLGTVLGLAVQHPGVTVPPFIFATVVGVSAVAHVLIGVNDVLRIRAGELAAERTKLSVLNRLVRHDLRNEAQVLAAAAQRIPADDSDAAARVDRTVDRLGDTSRRLEEFQAAIEEAYDGGSTSLATVVEDAAASFEGDLRLTIDVPDVAVAADRHLETAVERLLEHAVREAESASPAVAVVGRERGDQVELRVTCEAVAVPEHEREILTGEATITQLNHALGLGLWVVRTIVERYGGDLGFEDDGHTIVLVLPTAQ